MTAVSSFTPALVSHESTHSLSSIGLEFFASVSFKQLMKSCRHVVPNLKAVKYAFMPRRIISLPMKASSYFRKQAPFL